MLQAAGSNLILGAASRLRHTKASMTLNVSNTTGSIVMFTVTGSVLVYGLWGEVTTVISANGTAAFLRTNDQTANLDITLASGVTISALPVGSILMKEGLTGAALLAKSCAAGAFEEPASAGQPALSPFTLVKKTAAVTTLDFRYTTTDAPSSGVILWNALWVPLSADGNLA